MSVPTEEETTLELGDIWTLTSNTFGSITGKIIYRDENLCRIQSFNSTDRATNVPFGDDGDFAEGTGIVSAVLHAKRSDPHFTAILGASEGERLEFFSVAGEKVAGDGPAIIATIEDDDEHDAIVLTDGRRIDFAFMGPPPPIDVIRLRSADLDEGDTGEREAGATTAVEEGGLPDGYDLSLLEGLLPAAMVEEIPTADRTYPEAIQREDMYIDLLKDFSEIKQKNPTVLRRLARETELLLALKHAVTVTGPDGSPRPFAKSPESLQSILTRLGTPIASIIPVLAVKRILYYEPSVELNAPEKMLEQVEFRDWLLHELRNYRASSAYLAGQDSGAAQISTLMYTYLYDVLFREGSTLTAGGAARPGEEIMADQDVLRAVVPTDDVYGYPRLGIRSGVDDKNVTGIKTRQVRVLSSLKTKTQSVIVPGDTGTAVNYLLLPAHIGATWRPTKFSGTIAEDIRAGERTKTLQPFEFVTNNPAVYVDNGIKVIKNLESAEGADAGDVNLIEWIKYNLEQNVHPADLLSSGAVGVHRVLDSIGLRSYDWTPAVANTIWSSVKKAQANYVGAYDTFKRAVEAEPETPYEVGPGIPKKSTVYVQAKQVDSLAQALQKLDEINPDQGEWDLAQAQHIMSAAEGTLVTILYRKLTSSPELAKAEAIYKAEVRRSLLTIAAINYNMAKYKASPVLNTCPHVKDKDVLRQVMAKDDTKFYAVLQRFLKRYQGARSDNWVECTVCESHLICMHEIMLLYERTHPGRAPALHKEILLDYGGAAFNGKYVCRNCGVPISDFEYDTHLEYDDEGRPLVGRAAAEEEEVSAEDELDTILNISLKKKSLEFEDPLQQELYGIARVVAQSAGFALDEDTFKSIVQFTYTYVSTTLPPKDEYEAMTAKRKVRPSYESFKATTEVAITAVVVLCQIHTLRPLPEVLFPFVGCQFRRGGFPIETDNPTETGAMEYLVCVIANMNRASEPWDRTMWSTESSPDKRQNMVRDWMMRMTNESKVKAMLTKAGADYLEFTKDRTSGASSTDKLPFTFRPVQNTKPVDIVSKALYPDRILAAAGEAPLAEIQPVVQTRNYELAVGSIQNAHEIARQNSLVSDASVRSESICCFMPIQTVRTGALSTFNPPATELEIDGLRQAELALRRRDPTQQSNGTHLWVRWLPPEQIASIGVAPDSAYFKMFMRNCFKGVREGEPHEFGRRGNMYECRHCGFRVQRDPLVLMSDLNDEEIYNNDSKRKGPPRTAVQEEAKAALKAAGKEVTEVTFDSLLSAIRQRRFVDPHIEPVAPRSAELFTELNTLIRRDMPFMPARAAEWTLVETAMVANFKRESPPSEEARKITWAQFVSKYDALRNGLLDVLDGRQGKAPVRGIVRKVEDILAAVERITDDPIFQGPNEITKHWIIGLERLSRGFSEMVYGSGTWFGENVGSTKSIRNQLFGGTKWFGKKISQRHAEKFEDMIQKILGATHDTNKELNKPEIRASSSRLCQQLALYLGGIMRYWTQNLPMFSVWGVTNEELRYMLRWLVLSSIESLLLIESPLYSKIPKDSEKTLIQKILLGWTKSTFVEARRQFDQFGLTEEEIRLAILDAREKEKNSVIKEIDDEKDPDMRAVALVQKGLKMGRWGIGNAKNLTGYNAEMWDFLQEQRDRIGKVDNTNAAAAPVVEDAVGFTFGSLPEADRGFDTAKHDHEDE